MIFFFFYFYALNMIFFFLLTFWVYWAGVWICILKPFSINKASRKKPIYLVSSFSFFKLIWIRGWWTVVDVSENVNYFVYSKWINCVEIFQPFQSVTQLKDCFVVVVFVSTPLHFCNLKWKKSRNCFVY